MITTRDNVELQSGKTFTSAQDAQVDWAIIAVTGNVINFLNRSFRSDIEYSAETISFATNVISDSESGFGDFADGDCIEVCGSTRNDGWYKATTAIAASLTLDVTMIKGGALTTAAVGDGVNVYMLEFPQGLEQIAINMIIYDVFDRNKSRGLQSQSVGTYSETKMTIVNGINYPPDMVSGLYNYRYLRIV